MVSGSYPLAGPLGQHGLVFSEWGPMGEQVYWVCSSSMCVEMEGICCGAAEGWKGLLALGCGAEAGDVGQGEVKKGDFEGSAGWTSWLYLLLCLQTSPSLNFQLSSSSGDLSQNSSISHPWLACSEVSYFPQRPKLTDPILQQAGCTV